MLASKIRGDDEEIDIKFAQYGLKRHPDLADVPSMPEFTQFFKSIWDALDISVTGMDTAA